MPQRGRTKYILLPILLLATLSVTRMVAASPELQVRIEPARLEVRPNEDFVVEIVIEDVQNLGAFQFELAYDPGLLEVKDAAPGDFLVSTGRSPIPLGPRVDQEEGVAVFGAATFGQAPGPDGSGVLAVVTCTARNEGSAPLRLQAVQISDTEATPISAETEDGLVIVMADAAALASPRPSLDPSEATVTPVPGDTESLSTPVDATEASIATSTSGSARIPGGTVGRGWIVAGLLLAAVGVAILVVGLLSRRSGN